MNSERRAARDHRCFVLSNVMLKILQHPELMGRHTKTLEHAAEFLDGLDGIRSFTGHERGRDFNGDYLHDYAIVIKALDPYAFSTLKEDLPKWRDAIRSGTIPASIVGEMRAFFEPVSRAYHKEVQANYR